MTFIKEMEKHLESNPFKDFDVKDLQAMFTALDIAKPYVPSRSQRHAKKMFVLIDDALNTKHAIRLTKQSAKRKRLQNESTTI